MLNDLSDINDAIKFHKGSWRESTLAWEINPILWRLYQPKNYSFFSNVPNWATLLQEVIDKDVYDKLSSYEILSILFGIHCRNRIIDDLWVSMFERGITPRLLSQLSVLDSDKY